ncbi:MAG TPA: glycosyltransferase, partial [Bryobacteraceae bacterium]|nr:glycosyltransferase [Bryobacteraceae bacterium]
DELATISGSTGQPTQAFNTMTSPTTSQVNHQVAEFAWQVKQWLRPLGLRAFSFPCQMTGTGMAFPWDAIRSVKLNSASLAEDLKLGLELSLTGYSPIFCPSACVTSEFPTSLKGVTTQRKRWEQGHIEIITNDAPRLFWLAISRRNWRLLVLTLDLMVPPLSLLAMLLAGMFAISALAALIGFSCVAFIISAASFFALMAVIVAAWLNCGRHLLPASAIFSVVPFVLGKIGLYRQIVSGAGDAKWDRTDRKR